ncbi:MAG: hypothetical protein WBP94_07385 [Rhodomicrobiaceae bacterium]
MRLARWAGPALIVLGLAAILALALEPPHERSTLAWWILTNAFAYERILPLVGLGVLLALGDIRQCLTGLAAFTLGIVLGFSFVDSFTSALAGLPGAKTHLFLTGPILSIAVGVALGAPKRIGPVVLPVAAIIAGAMVAIALRLTNQSFHDPAAAAAGIAFAFWIPAAVSMTVWAFRQAWFQTAGRILGSWLIAIGVLYGGASLISPRKPALPSLPQAPQLAPEKPEIPGVEPKLPDLDQPIRRPFSGGFDPSRQP